MNKTPYAILGARGTIKLDEEVISSLYDVEIELTEADIVADKHAVALESFWASIVGPQ